MLSSLTPGCDSKCNKLKIVCWNLGGMYGRGVPLDTSHSIVMSAIGTGTPLKDKEDFYSISCINSALSVCVRAISLKSMLGCETVTTFVSIRERASATGFSLP